MRDWLLWNALALVLGFLLDCLVGDPQGWPHLVRLYGALISALEKWLYPMKNKRLGGTILTVLHDSAAACHYAKKKRMPLDEALEYVASEAFASVQRTPDLLPVLKENNVVDSGGFGLAILFEGFVAAVTGEPPVRAVNQPLNV